MMPPSAARKSARVARRGVISRLTSARSMPSRRKPETRTTPIPPRPGGVAIAAMTSLAMRRLGVLHAARNLPLLRDRKDVVNQPIEHQPRREKEKEYAESNRHYFHQFGLHRVRGLRIEKGLENHGCTHQHRQHKIRIRHRKIVDPPDERCMTQFDARQQNPIKRNKNRYL